MIFSEFHYEITTEEVHSSSIHTPMPVATAGARARVRTCGS
jgi:hypothetical protein